MWSLLIKDGRGLEPKCSDPNYTLVLEFMPNISYYRCTEFIKDAIILIFCLLFHSFLVKKTDAVSVRLSIK